MIRNFWRDEHGVIASTELILTVTVLGLGVIVGLTTLRNDVVTELADQAQAVSNVDQTYYYSGVSGHSASVAGSAFTDSADFCENGQGGSNEQCVVIGPNPGGGGEGTGGGDNGGAGGGDNGGAGGGDDNGGGGDNGGAGGGDNGGGGDDNGGGGGNSGNNSGLGDGTNPGQGSGTGNSPNQGTNNPNNSGMGG